MLENLATNAERFFAAARICWQDSRVPLMAKLFVTLAPLYWLHPADLIPDLQPGGQLDDIIIFSLLVVMAPRLVPEAVFRDARRAVLLGKKAAVVGLLYVTATSNLSCQATSASTTVSAVQQFSSTHSLAIAASSSASAITSTKSIARHLCKPHSACSASGANRLRLTADALGSSLPRDAIVAVSQPLRSTRAGLQICLATRSGQKLLYEASGSSAYQVPEWAIYSFEMPPQSAGGFFVVSAPPAGRLWLQRS